MSGVTVNDPDTGVVHSGQWFAASRGRYSERQGNTHFPSGTSSATNSRDSSQIPFILGPIFGAIVFCAIIYLWLRHRQKEEEHLLDYRNRLQCTYYVCVRQTNGHPLDS